MFSLVSPRDKMLSTKGEMAGRYWGPASQTPSIHSGHSLSLGKRTLTQTYFPQWLN